MPQCGLYSYEVALVRCKTVLQRYPRAEIRRVSGECSLRFCSYAEAQNHRGAQTGGRHQTTAEQRTLHTCQRFCESGESYGRESGYRLRRPDLRGGESDDLHGFYEFRAAHPRHQGQSCRVGQHGRTQCHGATEVDYHCRRRSHRYGVCNALS